MKITLYTIFLVLIAGILGYLVSIDSGYVLLHFNHVSVEMTFWIFVAALIGLLLVFYLLLKVVDGLKIFPKLKNKWQFYLLKKRQIRNLRRTNRVINFFAVNADLERAKRLAQKNARRLSSLKGIDNFVRDIVALENNDASLEKSAFPYLKAKYLAQNGRFSEVIELVQKEKNLTVGFLKLLVEACLARNNYQKLYELLPEIKKAKIYKYYDFLRFKMNVYVHLLNDAPLPMAKKYFHEVRDIIHKKIMGSNELIIAYGKIFEQNDKKEEARCMLGYFLKNHYSESLMLEYSRFMNFDKKTLKFLEFLAKKHPSSVALFTVLGMAYRMQKMYSKAYEYLAFALKIDPQNGVALKEIALLMIDIKQLDNAIAYYQQIS